MNGKSQRKMPRPCDKKIQKTFMSLLLFIISTEVFAQPCESWECDTTVIAKIIAPYRLNETLPEIAYSNSHPITRLDLGTRILPDTLSSEIGRLVDLKWLSLRYNDLDSLPDEICELQKLEHLYLDGNNLTELPDSIGKLTSLKSIEITENRLSRFPNTFSNLSKLEWVVASSNLILELPEDIGRMDSLKVLNLSANRLTSIPASLKDLTTLNALFLNHNELNQLPDEIVDLAFVNTGNCLWLDSNYLCNVPSEIEEWAEQYQPGWKTRQICNSSIINKKRGIVFPFLQEKHYNAFYLNGRKCFTDSRKFPKQIIIEYSEIRNANTRRLLW